MTIAISPLNFDTTCSQGSGLNLKKIVFLSMTLFQIPDFLMQRKDYNLNISQSPIKSSIETGTVLIKEIYPDCREK